MTFTATELANLIYALNVATDREDDDARWSDMVALRRRVLNVQQATCADPGCDAPVTRPGRCHDCYAAWAS